MRSQFVILSIWPGLVSALLFAGCKGFPTADENAARQQLAAVESKYRPGAMRPELPVLTPNSSLGELALFAVMNQPRIEAAYYEWRASVERITSERSLPDPRLTFKSDIGSVLLSLMPGITMDIPGLGKLQARARAASAESEVKYRVFEAAVIQAAYEVRRAYYQLYFLEDKIGVLRETQKLLQDLEGLARTQNEIGKSTLQDVLRAQIEQDKIEAEISNIRDSRAPLLAQLKASLGLTAGEPDPPVPARFETTALIPDSSRLLADALAHNPRLKIMEAEIRAAEAGISLARKSKVPDFSLGLEADGYSSPAIFTPQGGMTLPIWKDKISAEIAAAQARKQASQARLSAEQISLAVELADRLFAFRESSRIFDLLAHKLIPKAKMALDISRANYLSGKTDFFNLSDAWKTLLEFQLREIESRIQRELALNELSLLVAGNLPENAPLNSSN